MSTEEKRKGTITVSYKGVKFVAAEQKEESLYISNLDDFKNNTGDGDVFVGNSIARKKDITQRNFHPDGTVVIDKRKLNQYSSESLRNTFLTPNLKSKGP